MELGVMIFPTDKSIQPVELAKAAEDRGFESLWFPEHSHIPVSRKTPWGGAKDMPPLPEEYWRSHDQFIALAACAGVTFRAAESRGVPFCRCRCAHPEEAGPRRAVSACVGSGNEPMRTSLQMVRSPPTSHVRADRPIA